MKTKKSNLSKKKQLKEIEQKPEYKAENIDNMTKEDTADLDDIIRKSILSNAKSKKEKNEVSNNIKENNNSNEAGSKKHQRCVPLEIYKKVYQDKQILLNQVELLNKEITSLSNSQNTIKSKNEEIANLENKYKNIQREKNNIENILLNQEKYVSKLKTKIEKLEKNIMKKNDELLLKENTIAELQDKNEELKNKIITMKENFKLSEKKEIMKLNDQITTLSNEIEIKQSKIDYIDKRHKNLQNKYLKLLGDKRKMTQDNLFLYKHNNDNETENFNTLNSNTIKRPINKIYTNSESLKSTYSNMEKKENNKIKSKSRGKEKEMKLPEILNTANKGNKNKSPSPISYKKSSKLNDDKKNGKKMKEDNKESNNALKDIDMLLEDCYTDENNDNCEEIEDEDEEIDSKSEGEE